MRNKERLLKFFSISQTFILDISSINRKLIEVYDYFIFLQGRLEQLNYHAGHDKKMLPHKTCNTIV